MIHNTVVALTLLDLKRRGYIGDLHLCGVNGKKVLTGSLVVSFSRAHTLSYFLTFVTCARVPMLASCLPFDLTWSASLARCTVAPSLT